MLFQPSANTLGGPELLTLVIVMVRSPAPRDSPHELAFLLLLQLQRQSSVPHREHRAGPAVMAAGGTSHSE